MVLLSAGQCAQCARPVHAHRALCTRAPHAPYARTARTVRAHRTHRTPRALYAHTARAHRTPYTFSKLVGLSSNFNFGRLNSKVRRLNSTLVGLTFPRSVTVCVQCARCARCVRAARVQCTRCARILHAVRSARCEHTWRISAQTLRAVHIDLLCLQCPPPSLHPSSPTAPTTPSPLPPPLEM